MPDLSGGTIGSGLGGLTSIAGGIFSAVSGSEDASNIANIQGQMAQTEIQENQVRRSAMELTVRRQNNEQIRQAQMARSMALSTGTNQGAAYGDSSGLKGAYGSIFGQAGVNRQGINQNWMQGEQMFNLSDQLSEEKMGLAKAQSDAASNSAFGKMLGGIGSSMGSIGSLLALTPML